jgi:hypothetical protein
MVMKKNISLKLQDGLIKLYFKKKKKERKTSMDRILLVCVCLNLLGPRNTTIVPKFLLVPAKAILGIKHLFHQMFG